MVDDTDDPNRAPASNVPAGSSPPAAPAEDQPPPEGEQPEDEQQAETEAPAEDDLALADDEQDDDEEGDGEVETEKEKKTRLQRYKERAERLRAENEALRSRRTELPDDVAQMQRAFEARVYQELGDPPRPEDFKDDYVAFTHARQAYETDKRQVQRQVRRDFQQAITQERERIANLVSDHKERVEKFRAKVKDYDQVLAQATLPVAPHVERLLLNSKSSAQLTYMLGKNQRELARLNRLDPENAAREIGRLEGRLALPPKPPQQQQTQARKPITPLKGSGTAPATGLAAVNAYIKKKYGSV